jgi:tetratricopeptide (TPR) repeat protein
LSSLSPDVSDPQPLAGHLVVFTGKMSMLGRRDARALVARLGGVTGEDVNSRTTMLVVGAEGAGVGRNKSHKLTRAEELNAKHGAGVRILAEDEFCRVAGLPTPEALKRQYHAMRDLLARYDALREDHLRYLVKCGVIHPVLRTNADTYFAFPALPPIKQANDELAAGRSFHSVVRALMASREGQLALDFRLDAAPAKIVTLQRTTTSRPAVSSSDIALAERYFRAGSALDDGNETGRDRAATAYRKALEFNPYLVPALINLANIHYCQDEPTEAQALYDRAIALEPDYFEAHFNLGNIHHDFGRLSEALGCYREALRLNPGYPDGHFYLAVTLEKMGLSVEARPYWQAYRNLAPHGEWVELAREFSE